MLYLRKVDITQIHKMYQAKNGRYINDISIGSL
jgi:hypothetical protein